MFAIRSQNRPGLTIGRFVNVEVAAIADQAAARIKTHARFEIDFFTKGAFKFREDSRQPLGVVPDVGAGARAAIHAFPAIGSAIVKPVKHLCCQAIDRNETAVQEPMRQGAVIPGLIPLVRSTEQTLFVCGNVLSHIAGGLEPRLVVPAELPEFLDTKHLPWGSIYLIVVREIPGNHKINRLGLAGLQRESRRQATDK